VADIEVCLRVVILALFVVIIQHSAVDVEWAFKALAWAVVVTHIVYGVKNLVTHVALLLCLYVSIILPKRNPVNRRVIVA
jgi:hypothetical protein